MSKIGSRDYIKSGNQFQHGCLQASSVLRMPSRGKSTHHTSRLIKKKGAFSSPLTSQILYSNEISLGALDTDLSTKPLLRDTNRAPTSTSIQSSAYGTATNITSAAQRRWSTVQGWVVPITDERTETYKETRDVSPLYHDAAPEHNDIRFHGKNDHHGDIIGDAAYHANSFHHGSHFAKPKPKDLRGVVEQKYQNTYLKDLDGPSNNIPNGLYSSRNFPQRQKPGKKSEQQVTGTFGTVLRPSNEAEQFSSSTDSSPTTTTTTKSRRDRNLVMERRTMNRQIKAERLQGLTTSESIEKRKKLYLQEKQKQKKLEEKLNQLKYEEFLRSRTKTKSQARGALERARALRVEQVYEGKASNVSNIQLTKAQAMKEHIEMQQQIQLEQEINYQLEQQVKLEQQIYLQQQLDKRIQQIEQEHGRSIKQPRKRYGSGNEPVFYDERMDRDNAHKKEQPKTKPSLTKRQLRNDKRSHQETLRSAKHLEQRVQNNVLKYKLKEKPTIVTSKDMAKSYISRDTKLYMNKISSVALPTPPSLPYSKDHRRVNKNNEDKKDKEDDDEDDEPITNETMYRIDGTVTKTTPSDNATPITTPKSNLKSAAQRRWSVWDAPVQGPTEDNEATSFSNVLDSLSSTGWDRGMFNDQTQVLQSTPTIPPIPPMRPPTPPLFPSEEDGSYVPTPDELLFTSNLNNSQFPSESKRSAYTNNQQEEDVMIPGQTNFQNAGITFLNIGNEEEEEEEDYDEEEKNGDQGEDFFADDNASGFVHRQYTSPDEKAKHRGKDRNKRDSLSLYRKVNKLLPKHQQEEEDEQKSTKVVLTRGMKTRLQNVGYTGGRRTSIW